LKTSVEKLDGTTVKLTVTVPASEVDKAIDGTYVSVAKQVKIPGFRKGKAPRPIIDTHVGRDYVLGEATEEVVNSTYPVAIDAEGLRPIESPEIGDLDSVKPGEDFTYVAEIETRPELTLSSYDDISVELPPSKANDGEIDAQINYMAERFATLEPVSDRGVKVEDFVLLSFVGKVDGEEYDGNTVDKYLYEMSRGLMPVEFDRGLVGVEAGSETHIEFPIPDSSSNPEFVGRTATFDVTVHEIKAKVFPELNDEFAENVGGFESMDALRADIREKMDAQKSVAQMQLKERETRGVLAARLEGDIPEAMVRSRTSAMLRDFMTGLESRGTTIESYVAATGVDPEKLEADIREQAVESVREELALESLFRALEMEVTDADIDEELQAIGSESEESPEDLRKRWEEAGVMGALREQVQQRKAMLWLLDHVSVTEMDDSAGEGTENAESAEAKPPKKPAKKRAPKKKAAQEAVEDVPEAPADAPEPLAEDAETEG
jgi:trigger factor